MMLAFLVKRLLNAAGVMLSVAFVAFMIFRFVGDPVELMMSEQSTQAQRDELRVRLGLDRGFVCSSRPSSAMRRAAISASPIATSRTCSR